MGVGVATKMEALVASIVAARRQRRETRWRQLFAGFLASLQVMSAGAVSGWDPVDGVDEEWLPSVATLGAVAGAAPAGWLADLLGRRTLLMASAVPGVAGWALVALATLDPAQTCTQKTLLYVGRIVCGLSSGASSVAATVYNCEVSSDRLRGVAASLQYLLYAAGVAWARVLAASAPPLWLPCAAAGCQVLSAMALALAPESPVFLTRRGRPAAAEASLERLGAAEPARGVRELEELAGDQPGAARILRAGVIATGLMSLRQLVGARAVAALSRDVFPQRWTRACPPAAVLAAASALGAALPAAAGDSVARKALLTSSGAAMAVCHLATSVFLFVRGAHPGQDLAAIAWLPVTAGLAHAAAFGAGFGPLPWLLAAEASPPSARGAVVSLAACADLVLALVFTRAFYGSPASLQHPELSLVFCTSCCLGILFVLLYVPETRGRSLREVQRLLA